jgi:hypothetical protein
MPYRIAGIDVHKKMLAVAVADVEVEGDVHFERLKVGTSPVQLRALAEWLVEREVEEVVMESTAQYWRQRRGRSSPSCIVGSSRGLDTRKRSVPCPPALSPDLEDSPRGHSIRRTRSSGQRGSEEGADAQDDPRIASPRLSRRTAPSSIEQPGMIERDFRPWLIRAA